MNREPIEFAMARLAELEQVEAFRNAFSLSYWGNKADFHPLDVPEQIDCGFSGCFMGWAIHQQWFADFGLVLGFETVNPWAGLGSAPANPNLQIIPCVKASSSSQFYGYALYESRRSTEAAIEAVAKLFGVEDMTLGHVIYEESYQVDSIGMKDVRERLGELLELGEERFNEVMSERIEMWEEQKRDEDIGPVD
jgi:hypothetical protein